MNPAQLQQMMQQAQKMQKDIEKKQKKLETKEYSQTAGGGVLEVVVLGSKEIKTINMNDELFDVEDKEMVQDLLITTLNSIFSEIDKESDKVMGELTKGLPF